MKRKTINKETLLKFIQKAEQRLQGDWVIIGGAVLPLLGVSQRATVDIDIAGPPESPQSETLVLMEIADELGLPVEAINQAGAFFLRRIKGWEKMLVPLRSVNPEQTAVFFRPQVTLFVLLKMGRLSETDLQDCLVFMEFARRNDEHLDDVLVRKEAKRILAKNPPKEKRRRLEVLLDALCSA